MSKTADELKGEDRIDSRDIIEAQSELHDEWNDIRDEGHDVEATDDERELAEFDGENEIGGDWSYGVALIRKDTFQDYAQELAEDIGAIPDDVSWPMTCIDWEQAARELAMDYTSVRFLGYDYMVRA